MSYAARVSFAVCLLALITARHLQAAAFATNSFSDAFVTTGPSGNLNGNNYGGAGALSLAAPGLANGEFQSVLQFDLGGAKASFDSQFGAGQWSVQSLTLQLTAAPTNNSIFNATSAGQFNVFWMQNDSWTEGTGTPQTPTTTGITFTSLQSTFIGPSDENLGTFNFNGASSGSASYSLNLTPGLTADLQGGNLISLRMAAADSVVSYLFNSRNFGTAASRPLLTITVIPEPGSSVSFGGGMVFLVVLSRYLRCRSPKSL
jgi:hypothetical protein